MGVRRQQLAVTTDGSGAGTVSSAQPISGVILEIRNNSGAWGTATYAFTRGSSEGGGTVFQSGGVVSPFTISPRQQVTTAGTVILNSGTAIATIPVDGHLTMTVAGAATTTAGTVHVYYDDCCG